MRALALFLILAAAAAAGEVEQAGEWLGSEDSALRRKGAALLARIRSREAVELSAGLLDDPEHGEAAWRCVLGAWDRDAALDLLASKIREPDVVVGDRFLRALARLSRGENAIGIGGPFRGFPLDERWLKILAESLPEKRGPALVAAVLILALHDVPAPDLPRATAATWDDLPDHVREIALADGWERVGSEALVPALEKIVAGPAGYEDWHLPSLRSLAIRRLHDFRPERVRGILLEDMRRPRPLLAGCALTCLPDDALPEMDEVWLAALADRRNGDPAKIAPLIERYATAKLLPEVKRQLDVPWMCEIAEAFLGYCVKHDRAAGLDLVRMAALHRGEGATGLWRMVLPDVLGKYWGADAEALAIEFLDDPEEEVFRGVARLLLTRGSARCADALLDCAEALPPGSNSRGELCMGLVEQERWTLAGDQRRRLRELLPTDYARGIFDARYPPGPK